MYKSVLCWAPKLYFFYFFDPNSLFHLTFILMILTVKVLLSVSYSTVQHTQG